ncbi:ABC transporter substrate-binding protein [Clostridium grantii]|uniref:Putative aldouronate transport system substrate-binding protein n=1 Tax=Clostridium grantii DSM 8605 TaxID=1121316 RepID=A0A1M5U2T6_9CLOT|nr:ABC transporter substrate-binding protein [Clostridium grantii]SHH57274.1 putative aldouronate transport system substrate-binding protein [Clostridium grantii DSM 8605]
MKKRFLTLLITVSLLSSIALTGCGNKANNAPEVKESTNVSEPGEYPIAKEKINFTAFAGTRPAVDDFENNDFTKWMEEKTNIHFDWTVALEQDRQQKLNLLMASGNYTDVIFDSFFTPSEQYVYGSQGILIPLNDLIDKYAPNIKKALEDYPGIKAQLTMPDGNIYSVPKIAECYHCYVMGKMWINTEWLDKLGLEMPTTTDEFYNVLKAFKENDPNGNGKADEIALSGAQKGWMASPEIFIMNAFTYTNNSQNYLQVEDGKIATAYTKDEWKEGLKYLNKLFEEGLLDPQAYTQNGEQLKKLGENPGDVILGAAPGGAPGVFSNIGDSERYKAYKTVPALKGPAGEQNVYYNPLKGDATFNITDKCADPVAAIRWADANFEKEVMMRQVSGRPGEEWVEAKDGDIAIDGGQAEWDELVSPISDQAKGHTWSQVGPSLRTADYWLKRVSSGPDDIETLLYEESRDKYMPYIPELNEIVTDLVFSEEDSRTIVDIQTQLSNYVTEMMVKFISGTEDIDAGWDKYIAEFDNMNIKQYLEIYQKAYDEKQALK